MSTQRTLLLIAGLVALLLVVAGMWLAIPSATSPTSTAPAIYPEGEAP